ncbi:MAG: FtsX-like permease family protein [Bacteroidota bacterium]|nr:FtsX-like permease family protein [Bacteroidota bacterium]MDP4211421.1 FtsX-like permease family protein [Bacteroidota bacterium]MDP4248648.1 FtsX-like permease family protein [Bacteroidota bacterium]
MLRSYFKIVRRNLLKDRQFAFINIMGLSTGLACSLLICLWVEDELKFDRFHENDSRLFQIMANGKNANGIETIPQTPSLLAETLTKDFPEVEYAAAAAPTIGLTTTTLSVKENNIRAIGQFAGKDYLNIFSWHLIHGDRDHALAAKNSILISRDLALKLFNTTENIIGKTVDWQHEKQFIISGIFEGTPANSSIQFDYLLPFEEFLDARPDEKDWGNSDPSTYVVLKAGADIGQFNRKIAGLVKDRVKGSNTILFARPFSAGYLYGRYENGVVSGGRIQYVRLFSIIAFFILIIACVNFMNLSTAKASRRMKEVGVRKCIGASRQSLIFQYLGESMLMAFLSLILAIILLTGLLTPFNEITGKQLTLHFDTGIILTVLGVTLFVGLLSGSYPAFYLSAFRPVAVLKGKLKTSAGELWIRRGLVVFQFTLSVIFIVLVIVVYRQIAFIQSTSKGFNKDNIISFDMEGRMATPKDLQAFLSGIENLLAEVKNVPGVLNASSMDHESIIADFGSTSDIHWEGGNVGNVINFGNIGFNYGMIETLGMQMAAGRSFSKSLSSDSSEIIFNQAAIDMMGLKDPVGKTVKMWGRDRKIAGVVKNFHFESLHQQVKPFAIRLEPLYTYCIMAKIKAGQESQVIDRIRKLHQKYSPGFVFDYKFLDQDYQAQYMAEKRISVLSRYFAGLAILISCLGLFGLAAFTAQKRQKEIGIRKVVGATVGNVVFLLSVDFLKWVVIAVFIASPLAWWAASQWLNGFAYHIPIRIDIFLIAGLVTTLLTLATISFQSVNAGLTNPVNSLHSE